MAGRAAGCTSVVVVFHCSNKRQDGNIMLVNRNHMNWPFILFFKACSYLILLKGFYFKINIRRKRKKKPRERKRGKVSSYDCSPKLGSNK